MLIKNKIITWRKKRKIKREPIIRWLSQVRLNFKKGIIKAYQGIYSFICNTYHSAYIKSFRARAITYRVAIVLNIGVFAYGIYKKEQSMLLALLRNDGVLIGIILFFKLFHLLVGYKIVNEKEYRLTKQYLKEKCPHLLKIFGARTGVGKDRTCTAMTVCLASELKKDLTEHVKEERQLLYLFDMRIFDGRIKEIAKYLLQASDTAKRRSFTGFFKRNNGFFKKAYSDINVDYFIEDWNNQLQDLHGYNTSYIFNDGTCPKHYLELLYEYAKDYVRLNYVDNYVLSNQPILESNLKDKKIMSKMYSYDFQKLKGKRDKRIGANVFEEAKLYPWVEYLIVNETEVGIMYFNNDKEITQSIKEDGIRESKATNRHQFGEHVYFFQVDQKSSRVNKSIRELDHAHMNIIDSQIIPAGRKRRIIYFIQNLLHSLPIIKGNGASVLEYNKKLQEQKQIEVDRFERLKELETSNRKVRILDKQIEKIKNAKYKEPNKRSIKYDKFKVELKQKIENAKNDGYVKCQVVISDQEGDLVGDKPVTLKQILSKDKPLYNTIIKTSLTFKIKDTHGRYNTHVFETAGEERAEASEASILDVPNWYGDMKLNREQVVYLNYPSLNKVYDIKDNDLIQNQKLKLKEIK